MMAVAEKPSSNGNHPEQKVARAWPAWHAILSNYREPHPAQASWQLLNTLLPYCFLWFLMIQSIQRGYPYALTFALAVIGALFLVRIFVLFHDCVHSSFFRWKSVNTFFGYLLGVLVFTPFEDWRFSHLRHHATYANLDARGFGDIWTLTKAEYEASPRGTQLRYRFYRSPAVLLGLGALFNFLLRFRWPIGKSTRRERLSVLLTNLLIINVILLAAWVIGWRTYLLIQLPLIWMAGALGIWLFYVQHQFEGGYWARKGAWDPIRAAMEGSSFYKLPGILRWFSANIGYHHVHHLNPRIPNYRLKECFDAVPALQARSPLTIRESLSAIRLKLWDEERQTHVNFS